MATQKRIRRYVLNPRPKRGEVIEIIRMKLRGKGLEVDVYEHGLFFIKGEDPSFKPKRLFKIFPGRIQKKIYARVAVFPKAWIIVIYNAEDEEFVTSLSEELISIFSPHKITPLIMLPENARA